MVKITQIRKELLDYYEAQEKAFNEALDAFDLEYSGIHIFENYDIQLRKENYDDQGNKLFGGLAPKTNRQRLCFQRGIGYFYPASLDKQESTGRTLQHEFIGHHGINTFTSAQKYDLIRRLAGTRNTLSLKKDWAHVDKDYSEKTDFEKAEEIFCFIAEKISSAHSEDLNKKASSIWRDTIAAKTHPLEREDVQLIVNSVADGLRRDTRKLQTFPEISTDQFEPKEMIKMAAENTIE